jgi:methionine aminopeptidase
MVLAIEPMVNMGRAAVRVLDDGWTAVTQDGSLSAHFEHTVAVMADGPVVLSQPNEERDADVAPSGFATRSDAGGWGSQ